MKVYSGKGLGDFYYEILRDITNHGREVTVRGQRRVELKGPVVLEYTQPGACWMCIPGRKFNPFFALAEVFWILGGMGWVYWISYYNSKIKDIAADPNQSEFHGAYGSRLRKWPGVTPGTSLDQVAHVVRKLTNDPFSTQAVMSMWDPVRDNLDVSKDYPCNNTIYYSLRDGVLDQSVTIRSNDIVLGQPHNIVQFMHLQAYVAGMLGVKIGTLTYFVQNLHYYLDLYPPVLGSLLNLAFTEAEPGAVACPLFEPFGEIGLKRGLEMAENVINEAEEGTTGETDWVFLFKGYIDSLLPKMLYLFSLVKESRGVEEHFKKILPLPAPFPWLIQDFWKDSSRAQKFLEIAG